MNEFGSTSDVKQGAVDDAATPDQDSITKPGEKGSEQQLILEEERETGAVSWHVYYSYAQSMGTLWWAVIFGSFLALTQVAQVFNSLFLGWWTGSQFPGWTNGMYMAVYAGQLSFNALRSHAD